MVRRKILDKSSTDVQRPGLFHKIHRWMAATLDGQVAETGAVFEAKFMRRHVEFFGGSRGRRKHMAQLQHNMWVTASRTAVLSIITGGGKWVRSAPLAFQLTHCTSICFSRQNESSGAASKLASPLTCLASSRQNHGWRLLERST